MFRRNARLTYLGDRRVNLPIDTAVADASSETGRYKLAGRCYITAVHRLFALLLCFLVASTLGLGSVAHAMEPIGGLDKTEAVGLGHIDGDGDQVPADHDRGYPHHHGGCHGHQIGEPARMLAVSVAYAPPVSVPRVVITVLASTDPGLTLRPPRA